MDIHVLPLHPALPTDEDAWVASFSLLCWNPAYFRKTLAKCEGSWTACAHLVYPCPHPAPSSHLLSPAQHQHALWQLSTHLIWLWVRYWAGMCFPGSTDRETKELRLLPSKVKHLCARCQQVSCIWEQCQQQSDCSHEPSWSLKGGTGAWLCDDMDIFFLGLCWELSNSFISCPCADGNSFRPPAAWQRFGAVT